MNSAWKQVQTKTIRKVEIERAVEEKEKSAGMVVEPCWHNPLGQHSRREIEVGTAEE